MLVAGFIWLTQGDIVGPLSCYFVTGFAGMILGDNLSYYFSCIVRLDDIIMSSWGFRVRVGDSFFMVFRLQVSPG